MNWSKLFFGVGGGICLLLRIFLIFTNMDPSNGFYLLGGFVLSFYITLLFLSLLIIKRKKLPFTFKLSDIRLGKEIKIFVAIGAPLALQDVLTNITFLALCAFVNKLGLDASSG